METYRAPIEAVNNLGQEFNIWRDDRIRRMNTHLVHLDSRDRDTTQFPSANKFTMFFPRVYRGVYSVELLSGEFEFEPLTTENYMLIKVNDWETFDVMQGSDKDSPPANGSQCVWGRIQLVPNASSTAFYNRDGDYKVVRRWQDPIDKLAKLDIELLNYDGTLHDMTTGGNREFSMLLEITSMS